MTEITVRKRRSEPEAAERKRRSEPEIKSISTFWLIAVAAIVYVAGFLASLV